MKALWKGVRVVGAYAALIASSLWREAVHQWTRHFGRDRNDTTHLM